MHEELAPSQAPAPRERKPLVLHLAGPRSHTAAPSGLDLRLAPSALAAGRKDARWSTTTSS
jgi:hypothetical protein